MRVDDNASETVKNQMDGCEAILSIPYILLFAMGYFNSSLKEFNQKILNKININQNVTDCTPLNAPPSLSLYNTTASFGVSWDDTWFYYASYVKDPNALLYSSNSVLGLREVFLFKIFHICTEFLQTI